jgi:hypothetical protein
MTVTLISRCRNANKTQNYTPVSRMLKSPNRASASSLLSRQLQTLLELGLRLAELRARPRRPAASALALCHHARAKAGSAARAYSAKAFTTVCVRTPETEMPA